MTEQPIRVGDVVMFQHNSLEPMTWDIGTVLAVLNDHCAIKLTHVFLEPRLIGTHRLIRLSMSLEDAKFHKRQLESALNRAISEFGEGMKALEGKVGFP